MAIRDKFAAAAAPYLDPGEEIHAVIGAAATDPTDPAAMVVKNLKAPAYRALIVTDRRILLFRSRRWAWTRFDALLAQFPRAIRFGEPDRLTWRTDVLGTPLWIQKRFHGDVRRADALAPC